MNTKKFRTSFASVNFALCFLLAFLMSSASVLAQSVIQQDKLKLGRGAATNKEIEFSNGVPSTNPRIRWNSSTSQLEFSNNNTIFKKFGSGEGGGGGGINLLSAQNAEFEDGFNVGWTNSGGSYTEATSGSNLLFDAKSAVFDPSADAQYFQSPLVDIPEGLKGKACLAYIHGKGGDGSIKLQVLNASGDDLFAGKSMFFAYDTGKTEVNAVPFICPATGQIRLRIASTSNGAAMAFDKAYLGSDSGQFQISQARKVARAYHGAAYQNVTTTSATKIALNFSNLDVYGELDTATNFRYTARTARKVVVDASAYVVNLGAAEVMNLILYKNGSALAGKVHAANSAGNVVASLTADLDLVAGDYLELYVQSTSDTNYNVADSDQLSRMHIYEFPSETDTGRRYDTVGWYIDTKIHGANPSLGTAAVSSFTGIENGSLTLAPAATSTLAVGIPCSSTNAGTVGSTTCAAGSESVGITFNLPIAPQMVEVCAAFAHGMTTTTTGDFEGAFQLIETGNATQTIVQEGGDISNDRVGLSTAGSTTSAHKTCGTFNFTTAGQKTIRLMYEQNIRISGQSASVIYGDRDASVGQRDIRITARPLTQQVPVPILSGPYVNMKTVTSGYTALAADDFISGTTSGGAFTITLPTAVGIAGKTYTIHKGDSSSNLLTVASTGSQVIGTGSATSTKLHLLGDSITLRSDGAKWLYISDEYRTEQAEVTMASNVSCTVSQLGAWMGSTSPTVTGNCTPSFVAGIWATAPKCEVTMVDANAITFLLSARVYSISTSNLSIAANFIQSGSSTVAGSASPVLLTCRGKR